MQTGTLTNSARDGKTSRIIKLRWELVLKDSADFLRENNLLMIMKLSLVSAKVLQEFRICRNLTNSTQQWNVDFHLLKDLQNILCFTIFLWLRKQVGKMCLLFVMFHINRFHEIGCFFFCQRRALIINCSFMLLLMLLLNLRCYRVIHFVVNNPTTSKSGDCLHVLMLSWIHLRLARKSTRLSLTHSVGQLSHLDFQLRKCCFHVIEFLVINGCLAHDCSEHLLDSLCWCVGSLSWSLKLILPHVGWLIGCCRCVLSTLRVTPLKSWVLALILIVPLIELLLRLSPSRIHKTGLFCSRWLHVTVGRKIVWTVAIRTHSLCFSHLCFLQLQLHGFHLSLQYLILLPKLPLPFEFLQ